MKRVCVFALAVLGMVWLCTGEADAQKKDKKAAKNTADKATPEDYKQIRNLKELTGKLVYADANNHTLTLRIEIPHMEPNPNFKPGGGGVKGGNNNQYQQLQNLYRQQAQVQSIQNPVQRQQKMMQIMQQIQKQQYQQMMQAAKGKNGGGNNNTPFRLVQDNKDFDLEIAEKVVVRKMFLPREFDDKGFLKEYTKEEMAKLKGSDKSKPGFEAKLEELVNGQTVKLVLAAPKKVDPKADADGVGNIARPLVTTIYILQDSSEPLFTPQQQPKKKAK